MLVVEEDVVVAFQSVQLVGVGFAGGGIGYDVIITIQNCMS